MEIPTQICFRGIPPSDAVKLRVFDHVEKLSQFCDSIISCEVNIERRHHHRTKGNVFHIKIHLRIPGPDIIVGREPERNAAHADVYVALRDAFSAASRQLQGYVRRERREVKTHQESVARLGMVVEIHPEEGYGFIEADGGERIYFHRDRISSAVFQRLEEGTDVHFFEEDGDETPRATRVTLLSNGNSTVDESEKGGLAGR